MSESNLIRAAREAGLESEVTDAVIDIARHDDASNANRRFLLAILGVLPWVGVIISASISRWAYVLAAARRDELAPCVVFAAYAA
jgi:hypothetical protein